MQGKVENFPFVSGMLPIQLRCSAAKNRSLEHASPLGSCVLISHKLHYTPFRRPRPVFLKNASVREAQEAVPRLTKRSLSSCSMRRMNNLAVMEREKMEV
jgi:hypothetical protein